MTTIDEIPLKEKKNEAASLSATEKNELNAMDPNNLRNLKDVIWKQEFEIGWKKMKLEDIVKNFNTVTNEVTVDKKDVQVTWGSDLAARIQMFLIANKISVHTNVNGNQWLNLAIDGKIGAHTKKAIEIFKNGATKGTNNNSTNNPKTTPETTPEILSNADIKALKKQIDELDESEEEVKKFLLWDKERQKMFLWARNKNIIPEGRFQSTSWVQNGYYTINWQSMNMNIKISPINKDLPWIADKYFPLNLKTSTVKAMGTAYIERGKFMPELYSTISKMYEAETLSTDLSGEIKRIRNEYNTIVGSSKSSLVKYPKIDKLIKDTEELKAEAEKTRSTDANYKNFITGRTADIKEFSAKSNEYKRLSITEWIANIYSQNATEQWQLSPYRIKFLEKEEKELKNQKDRLTLMFGKKLYEWGHEAEYDTQLKKINELLTRNQKEKPYVESCYNDNKEISNFEIKTKKLLPYDEGQKLGQDMKDLYAKFIEATHKKTYTDYDYKINGKSIGETMYTINKNRIEKLLNK